MTAPPGKANRLTIAPASSTLPDTAPAMTSDAERGRLIDLLAQVIGPCVEANLPDIPAGATTRVRSAIEAFLTRYPQRPIVDNSGGSGFNDSLWLFVVARVLSPQLIVESGTHRGHSAWLFRQACPQAEIHSFDIAPERLQHREPDVTYHGRDWSEVDILAKDPARSLLFLDDHISHARRLREAHARSFRRILLDDNFPPHALYATGGPPLPTLAMMADPSLRFGSRLSWQRKGKAYSYLYDEAEEAGALALVAQHLVLPELAPITRYPLGSCLTWARLID